MWGDMIVYVWKDTAHNGIELWHLRWWSAPVPSFTLNFRLFSSLWRFLCDKTFKRIVKNKVHDHDIQKWSWQHFPIGTTADEHLIVIYRVLIKWHYWPSIHVAGGQKSRTLLPASHVHVKRREANVCDRQPLIKVQMFQRWNESDIGWDQK